jgi:hypothetical protein
MISLPAFYDELQKISSAHIDKIKGGIADKLKPSDVDQKELKEGVKDEFSEHTNSKSVAKEIAMDHLAKEPHYYSNMKKLEKKANGDMLQYFADNPQKLKEKLKRDKLKK